MLLEEHIVGFGTEQYEGGWLIYFRGSLPASEAEMSRDEADTKFIFCPICGARILSTGNESRGDGGCG